MNRPTKPGIPWWERHRSLTTAAATMLVLVVGSLTLVGHVATSPSNDSPHSTQGDLVYFGALAAMTLLVGTVLIMHQRRSRP